MCNYTSFPCDQCGECCRHIDQIPQLATFDLGNGTCRYLEGNTCSIYNDRPEICRVDAMYEHFFKEQYTKKEFYQLNIEGCNTLRYFYKMSDTQ